MNKSKIYRLQLNHNCGEMFAILDDFTHVSEFDGRIVSVFQTLEKLHLSKQSRSSSRYSLLGPFFLFKMPSKRKDKNWEFIENSTEIYSSIPPTKTTNYITIGNPNWNMIPQWLVNGDEYDSSGNVKFVNYSAVRSLETRILQTPNGVCIKATMLQLLKSGKDVWEYYDIGELGNRNLFEELVNTYFEQNEVDEIFKNYVTTS